MQQKLLIHGAHFHIEKAPQDLTMTRVGSGGAVGVSIFWSQLIRPGFPEPTRPHVVCTADLLIQSLCTRAWASVLLSAPGDSRPWGSWRISTLRDPVTSHCHLSTPTVQAQATLVLCYCSGLPRLFLPQGLCTSLKCLFICLPLSVHPGLSSKVIKEIF